MHTCCVMVGKRIGDGELPELLVHDAQLFVHLPQRARPLLNELLELGVRLRELDVGCLEAIGEIVAV